VRWFLVPESQVSAHFTVGKDGKIVQMVEDTARAWHAGVSELDGVRGVNDFSVGIEIVNLNDGRDPYTDAQYEAVANIIRHLREQYYLPDSRIVSHEHVARPPGRKSDPKGFDFQRLFRMLRER
jgi:N-acetyl-anhydromuramyl-L-alanine amidase AmpD